MTFIEDKLEISKAGASTPSGTGGVKKNKIVFSFNFIVFSRIEVNIRKGSHKIASIPMNSKKIKKFIYLTPKSVQLPSVSPYVVSVWSPLEQSSWYKV